MKPVYLNNLLQNINLINSKYKDIEKATGSRFNIFSVLKMQTKEVKLHSAFIAELLNPNGSHDMDTVFLDIFVSVLRKRVPSLNFSANSKTIVNVELVIGAKTDSDGGRLDVILTDEIGNGILIENKIYAGDQESQLVRYSNYYLKQKYLLYLTLLGDEPSLESSKDLVNETDFFCVSYSGFILDWLTGCYNSAISHPTLRESLVQYIKTIKQLTGISMSDNKEKQLIYKTVGYSVDNVLAANELIKVWVDIKWFTEWDFWEELYETLSNSSSFKFIKTYNPEKLNGAVHSKQNKNPWYGIECTYVVGDNESLLSIERGFNNLYYKYSVIHNTENDLEFSPIFKERLKREENGHVWYEQTATNKVNFHLFVEEDTIKLMNSTFRKSVVNSVADEVKTLLINLSATK